MKMTGLAALFNGARAMKIKYDGPGGVAANTASNMFKHNGLQHKIKTEKEIYINC